MLCSVLGFWMYASVGHRSKEAKLIFSRNIQYITCYDDFAINGTIKINLNKFRN